MRVRIVVAALATLLPLAAGCSSADEPDASPGSSGSPDASDLTAVGWSPCDGLTAASVEGLVGESVEQQLGTAAQPQCTFTPTRRGGAAYDLSYLWFDGSLDEALAAMGAAGAQLEPLRIDGASSARIVADPRTDGLLVTGFVQTDGLVQSVNAVQLAPYDEERVVAGTRRLLTTLAKRAPEPAQG